MTVLGITGPSGAGKSLCSDYLKTIGIPVIDADEVYHGLLLPPSPCLDALRDAFGNKIFFGDGTLNRPALSEIVFHDQEKLALLNRTVLGFVLEEIRRLLREFETEGKPVVAVDAPTLIESGFHKECTLVISVLSSPETRLSRIMTRDHLTREAAEARIHAQREDDFYRRHSHAVLLNEDDPQQFFASVATLLDSLGLCPTS